MTDRWTNEWTFVNVRVAFATENFANLHLYLLGARENWSN